MSSFDRVQHDALMARVARRVHDKRVLKLIRRYVEAGVMADGLVHASEQGTQGSPLSPLLSNVMLDDLGRELENRGHRFVRYADDGRIYVSSERSGQRVMSSITQYVEQRMKLKDNRQKSVVDRATTWPLLEFGFPYRRGASGAVRAPRSERVGPQSPASYWRRKVGNGTGPTFTAHQPAGARRYGGAPASPKRERRVEPP